MNTLFQRLGQIPKYRTVSVVGMDHQQTFHVELSAEIVGVESVQGKGSTLRQAHEEAASALVEIVNKIPHLRALLKDDANLESEMES